MVTEQRSKAQGISTFCLVVRETFRMIFPLVSELCLFLPVAPPDVSAVPPNAIFPLHPSTSGWTQESAAHFLCHVLPFRVAPFCDSPNPSGSRSTSYMTCPKPLAFQMRLHPHSHATALRKTFCFPRHSAYPFHPLFIWGPPGSRYSPQHFILSRL